MRTIVSVALFVIGLVLCMLPHVLSSCQSPVGKDVFEDLMNVMLKIKCSSKENGEPIIKPAFLASLKQSANLGTNTVVKFENVQTNIGNGYDPTTGTFTAPSPGVYEFSCNFIKGYNDDVLELNIMQNGKLVARGHCDQSKFSSGSLQVILELKKGDQIYVSHPRSSGGIYGDNFSMFSGHSI